jgi:hypothetical protein
MKTFITSITLVLLMSITMSCKKDYSCKATAYDEEYVFTCENCSKNNLDDYKKEIEEKGYSNVSCDKK